MMMLMMASIHTQIYTYIFETVVQFQFLVYCTCLFFFFHKAIDEIEQNKNQNNTYTYFIFEIINCMNKKSRIIIPFLAIHIAVALRVSKKTFCTWTFHLCIVFKHIVNVPTSKLTKPLTIISEPYHNHHHPPTHNI